EGLMARARGGEAGSAEIGGDEPLAEWERELLEGQQAEQPTAEQPTAEQPAAEEPAAEEPAEQADQTSQS
ncbi:MAG: 30S ribosomal protein S2, partial [Actinomycetota bacterium]